MYNEIEETIKLYKLLSEKLGTDTTYAIFKYIDNRAETTTAASIATLVTKNDHSNFRTVVDKEITEMKLNTIKLMFIFWIVQASIIIGLLYFWKSSIC